ncbi:MAG: HD domain-containing protein [Chloroflexota bacterium]|nr:HD domain-containing protein [Chloroflexota bacterium]
MTVTDARRRPPIPRTVSAAIRELLRRLDRAEQLHASDVSFYALMIGESLDLSPELIRQIACGALLHDIGKIAIPLGHRDHSGAMTAVERLNMLTHPEIGEAMVSVHPSLAPFAGLVRHHHERFDGHGYPDGLVGGAIPIGAAVLAVSEAFATMIAEQPYQRARTWHQALDEIRLGSGAQFHPVVADAFLIALGEEPARIRS